ncbi:MAG: hypothetical protein LH679_15350 [Cyanobacteria bacterium CAN_BIN43]|nr:hypothetical protein [Cyanobacteria bacterium CAN_BIN43]
MSTYSQPCAIAAQEAIAFYEVIEVIHYAVASYEIGRSYLLCFVVKELLS